ncbi:hypothetical protein [Streptomyces mirabilis]|uniref:hypothetical protein n=1 Tax=Streptomyces TaxID=1883 RepID=UPI0039A680FA
MTAISTRARAWSRTDLLRQPISGRHTEPAGPLSGPVRAGGKAGVEHDAVDGLVQGAVGAEDGLEPVGQQIARPVPVAQLPFRLFHEAGAANAATSRLVPKRP